MDMRCLKCKVNKHLSEFAKKLDSRRQPCKECLKAVRKEGRAFDREQFPQDGNYWDDKTIELMKMMRPTKL